MSSINSHIGLITHKHKRDTNQTTSVPDSLSYLFTSTHSQSKTQNSPSSQTGTKSSWYRHVTMVTRWRLTFQLELSDFRWEASGQYSCTSIILTKTIPAWEDGKGLPPNKVRQRIKKQRGKTSSQRAWCIGRAQVGILKFPVTNPQLCHVMTSQRTSVFLSLRLFL